MLSGKYHVINYLEFLLTVEATWLQPFKAKNTMKMTLLNLMVTNMIQIALGKELFADLKDEIDNIEEGANSDVDNS